MAKVYKANLKVRIAEGHYAGSLVDGGTLDRLIGDAATELLIRHDGDEGLFRVKNVEYLAPVYKGDFVEVRGKITKVGNTSRQMEFEIYKYIANAGVKGQPSACDLLKPPELVAKATGVCVVPKECQRRKHKEYKS